MGFGDFVEDVGDAVSDFAGDMAARAAARRAAIEYRKKARKYEKLVIYLEEKIALIDTKLEDVKQDLSSQHEYFTANPESAQGMLITTFDAKVSVVWKKQYETIITNMNTGLISLRMKKSSAEQLQIYWEQKAEIEEAKSFGGF